MEPVPGPTSTSAEQSHGDLDDPGQEPTADELVDQWGEESFPASDPPGRLPPSLDSD